jgi:hypothetical protein
MQPAFGVIGDPDRDRAGCRTLLGIGNYRFGLGSTRRRVSMVRRRMIKRDYRRAPNQFLTGGLSLARLLQGLERACCHAAGDLGHFAALVQKRLHIAAQQPRLDFKYLAEALAPD